MRIRRVHISVAKWCIGVCIFWYIVGFVGKDGNCGKLTLNNHSLNSPNRKSAVWFFFVFGDADHAHWDGNVVTLMKFIQMTTFPFQYYRLLSNIQSNKKLLAFPASGISDNSKVMMTSSNGKDFRLTGPFWWESTGYQLITSGYLSQKDSNVGCNAFFDVRLNKLINKLWSRRWFKTPGCSMWRHCNGFWKWDSCIVYHPR